MVVDKQHLTTQSSRKWLTPLKTNMELIAIPQNRLHQNWASFPQPNENSKNKLKPPATFPPIIMEVEKGSLQY